jgi:hypothetical protein
VIKLLLNLGAMLVSYDLQEVQAGGGGGGRKKWPLKKHNQYLEKVENL